MGIFQCHLSFSVVYLSLMNFSHISSHIHGRSRTFCLLCIWVWIDHNGWWLRGGHLSRRTVVPYYRSMLYPKMDTYVCIYINMLHRIAMSYHKVCKLLNHMYTLSTDWGSGASSTSVDSNKTQAEISFICLSCINNICSRTWASLPKKLLQFRHVQIFPAAWNLQNGTALDLIKLSQYK